ncbi:uncharacterized protein TNCV_4253501 [Trichonephila clavipes]|nr:uncharacterized protein TNCV_4253501 [Trichonephila clavipes]
MTIRTRTVSDSDCRGLTGRRSRQWPARDLPLPNGCVIYTPQFSIPRTLTALISLVSGYSTFQCYLGRQLFSTYSHYCSFGFTTRIWHWTTTPIWILPHNLLFSSASNGTAPTPCEELTTMKIYLRRLHIICSEKERTVSLLRQDKGHHESDTLYQLAWNEYQDVQSSLQQAVSDFDSLPPVPTLSARIMSRLSLPLKIHPPPSPTRRNTQLKRKDDDDFEFPPTRKTARKAILQDSQEIGENQFSLLPNVIIKQVSGQLASSAAKNSESTTTANQNNRSNALPPPLMLKTDENYRVQVDTIKKIYPHLRLKTTGEYIKLYSNTTEQNRIVRQTLIELGYRFYVITPKNERPIKVVIKGFPKKANPEEIKKDLEKEGFEPDRVTQLVGRRTKQLLPIFQVTLPRTIENLKFLILKL